MIQPPLFALDPKICCLPLLRPFRWIKKSSHLSRENLAKEWREIFPGA